MIGIFDSGSGGLTVLKAVRERMPSADILYFGDIKNAPYGSKSNSELSLLTVRAIELLQKRGAGSIVSACNSVSASLAISLFDALSLTPTQLIEMVGPTVATFKNSSARLLLAATPATIGSEIYQNAFRMIGKEVETIAIPTSRLPLNSVAPKKKMRVSFAMRLEMHIYMTSMYSFSPVRITRSSDICSNGWLVRYPFSTPQLRWATA